MTVDSVDSCSNYTFAVRCASAGALWSNWSQEKTVLTPLKSKNCLQITLTGSLQKQTMTTTCTWKVMSSAVFSQSAICFLFCVNGRQNLFVLLDFVNWNTDSQRSLGNRAAKALSKTERSITLATCFINVIKLLRSNLPSNHSAFINEWSLFLKNKPCYSAMRQWPSYHKTNSPLVFQKYVVLGGISSSVAFNNCAVLCQWQIYQPHTDHGYHQRRSCMQRRA